MWWCLLFILPLLPQTQDLIFHFLYESTSVFISPPWSTMTVFCSLDKQPADYVTINECLDHPTIKLLYICTQCPQEITLCSRDGSELILNQIFRKMYSMNGLKSYPGSPLPWGLRAPAFCRVSWVLLTAKEGFSVTSDARGDLLSSTGFASISGLNWNFGANFFFHTWVWLKIVSKTRQEVKNAFGKSLEIPCV